MAEFVFGLFSFFLNQSLNLSFSFLLSLLLLGEFSIKENNQKKKTN
jgi:hypothetical protein